MKVKREVGNEGEKEGRKHRKEGGRLTAEGQSPWGGELECETANIFLWC